MPPYKSCNKNNIPKILIYNKLILWIKQLLNIIMLYIDWRFLLWAKMILIEEIS